jgi:hypothetical protein
MGRAYPPGWVLRAGGVRRQGRSVAEGGRKLLPRLIAVGGCGRSGLRCGAAGAGVRC